MLRHRLPLLIFAVLTLLVVAGDLFACPNCKDVLPSAEDGTQRGAVAEGFYYSILFMMSTPFLLAGTFGGVVWYYTRKASPRTLIESAGDPTSV